MPLGWAGLHYGLQLVVVGDQRFTQGFRIEADALEFDQEGLSAAFCFYFRRIHFFNRVRSLAWHDTENCFPDGENKPGNL